MEVYNVWVCVEKIDEAKEDNGEDIEVYKLAKFKKKDKAIEFALDISKIVNIP